MIGLGIVGLGRWANAHAAAAARSERVELVNCYARSEDSRKRFMETHGVGADSTSLEALVADPAVRAVVISSPNDVHAGQARTVIEAGKPVLIDKPLAVDVAEGLALVRLSKVTGVPIGVAHHARRLAGHRAAKDWIDSDAGEVRLAYGDFSNSRGSAMKPDAWHRSARGAEAGVLIQVGIHQVDTLLSLLGPVSSVHARFEHQTMGPTMPDAAVVSMRHVNGALSVVSSSWTTPSRYRTDLMATGGNLSFTLDHGHWTSGDVDDHGSVMLDTGTSGEKAVATVKGDPLRDQIEELGRAAEVGSPMLVDATAGLRAIAVVQASVLSAGHGGCPVDLEQLLRDAGATDDEMDAFFER